MKRMARLTKASFDDASSAFMLADDEKNQTKKKKNSHYRMVGGPLVSLTFTLEELQWPGPYPEGVQVEHRETYLSDVEFVQVFEMERGVFGGLPRWRQKAKKKAVKLF